MIQFGFYISSYELITWRSLWDKDFGCIFPNKYLEMQLMRSGTLLDFQLDLSWRGHDHAGPSLNLGLLTWEFNINIYDHRHWDYEKHTWEVYDGSREEEHKKEEVV